MAPARRSWFSSAEFLLILFAWQLEGNSIDGNLIGCEIARCINYISGYPAMQIETKEKANFFILNYSRYSAERYTKNTRAKATASRIASRTSFCMAN